MLRQAKFFYRRHAKHNKKKTINYQIFENDYYLLSNARLRSKFLEVLIKKTLFNFFLNIHFKFYFF